jgi:hypothetical protein
MDGKNFKFPAIKPSNRVPDADIFIPTVAKFSERESTPTGLSHVSSTWY